MTRVALLVLAAALWSTTSAQTPSAPQPGKAPATSGAPTRPLITFIELGSVNCIPCKAMQPVMKAIEEKYGAQVTVVFYDVWKEEQAHRAREYNIRLIPTQVFLDASGREILRHEGFFPEKDIDAFLQSRGVKPRSSGKG
jgi:thioredoxin 1